MNPNKQDIDPDELCRPRSGRWRYRLLGVIVMGLGVGFSAAAVIGLDYVTRSFGSGRTWEMGTMAMFCAFVALVLLGVGLRLFARAPRSDAIRMMELRQACLWDAARWAEEHPK